MLINFYKKYTPKPNILARLHGVFCKFLLIYKIKLFVLKLTYEQDFGN